MVVVTTIGLLATVARRGWIPLDEGTLAQTASRILDGQVPHVDFLDVYPGFQGVAHALLFSVFGESLATLRLGWLAMSGVAAVSAYSLLANRVSRGNSAVSAISIVVFSFVIYPASMPSWWNAALGLAGVALVFKAWKGNSRILAALAGLLLGCSALTKSTGGLLVAIPVGVWLVSTEPLSRPVVRRIAVGSLVVLWVALLIPSLSLGRLLFLGLPAACVIVAFLTWGQPAQFGHPKQPKCLASSFLVGLGFLPVIVVLAYAAAGHGGDLIRGWIVSPSQRFDSAEADIPVSLAMALLCVVVFTIASFIRFRGLHPVFPLLVVCGFFMVMAVLEWAFLGRLVIGGVAFVSPVVGIALLKRSSLGDPLTLLTASSALFFTLIQIPYWNGFYTAYSVPLLFVAVVTMVGRNAWIVPPIALLAIVFFAQTVMGRLVTSDAVQESVAFVELQGSRGGVLIPYWDEYYNDLTERLAVVADGSSVYAGPDSPEVAFLAGLEQQTPAFFEVLDPNWVDSIPGDLAESGSVVVINHDPHFTSALPPAELERIRRANPESERFDHFELTFAGGSER